MIEHKAERHLMAAKRFAVVSYDILMFVEWISEVASDTLRSSVSHMLALDPSEPYKVTGDIANQAFKQIPSFADIDSEADGDLRYSDPNNYKLQMMYRTAAEYRTAHHRASQRNSRLNDFFSFSVFLLATGVGLALFMGEKMALSCAIGTAVIAGLNATTHGLDFAGKQQRHSLSTTEFSALTREMLTLLMSGTKEEVNLKLSNLSTRFNVLLNTAPILRTDGLKTEVDPNGERIFKFIVHDGMKDEVQNGLLIEPQGVVNRSFDKMMDGLDEVNGSIKKNF